MTKRIVDELIEKVQVLPSGAKSLSHITLKLPTAESARRLRLALAKKLGAYVPFEVESLKFKSQGADVATRTDELVAFARAIPTNDYAFPAMLADLRHILVERALSFSDVAELGFGAKGLGASEETWQKLKEIELRYYKEMEKLGKRDIIELAKEKNARS